MSREISALIYLLAAALFIYGLKRLSSPKTIRNGCSARHGPHHDAQTLTM